MGLSQFPFKAFGIAGKRGGAGAITVQKRALLVAGTISDDGAGRTSPGGDDPQLAGRSALCREEFFPAECGHPRHCPCLLFGEAVN